MKFTPMTPQQKQLYAELRQAGAIHITPENARVLHALKRRGLVRLTRDHQELRIAVLRLKRSQRRVLDREARLEAMLDQVFNALPTISEWGILGKPAPKRKLKHGTRWQTYRWLTRHDIIPKIRDKI